MNITELRREELGNLIGEFYWDFGHTFYIETSIGRFLWSDSEYPGGTNEIKVFSVSFEKVCKYLDVPMMRYKGSHRIKDYCPEFIWKGNEILFEG
jgi:hypothetical protein